MTERTLVLNQGRQGKVGLEQSAQANQFAVRQIEQGETWFVQQNQEMTVEHRLSIEGRLVQEGRLVVGREEAPQPIQPTVYPENFGYFRIRSGVTVVVPDNQEMFASVLEVEGRLEINGRVSVEVKAPEDDVQEEIPWSISANKIHRIVDGFQKWFLSFELAGRLEIEGSGRLIVGG